MKRVSENGLKTAALFGAALVLAMRCSSSRQGKSVEPKSDPAATDVVAPGAVVQKLAGGFAFTEGPTADAAGNLFFTDQPNNRILQWSVDGILSVFLESAQRSNGMEFDAGGALISCADEFNRLVSIDPSTKTVTVLVEGYGGKRLNGPNDVWIDPDGGMYFTDPYYQRPWWTHTSMEQDGQHVYYMTPDRNLTKRVIDDFVQPNGIVGAPDGKTLYVADIGAGRTWAYGIQSGGALSGKRLLASEGSDGMTVDAEGNVYLTNRAVSVFAPNGTKLRAIEVPEMPANVAFGGADRRTLFITARTSLYALRTRVRGL